MDVHFNSYKAKYMVLDQAMEPIIRSRIIRTINVFVNLDDVLRILHQPRFNNEISVSGKDTPLRLTSEIFNLLGHYRYWGIKHHYGIRVFGIYTLGTKRFKNTIYIGQYRKHYFEHYDESNANCFFVNNAIKTAEPLFPILSKYIPGVYMINTKYMEPSVIPLYIAQNKSKTDWNILISRDSYDLQYAYRDKWTVITPKGENTRIIDSSNLWKYVAYRESVYHKMEEYDKQIRSYDDIPTKLYPFELFVLSKATVGDRLRSIPRLRRLGWKTLFQFMNDLVEEFPNDVSDTTLKVAFINKIAGKGKNKLTAEAINKNLYATNIDLQIDTLLDIDKLLIDTQIIDVPDYNNLQELNRTRFFTCPLNLQFLCNIRPQQEERRINKYGYEDVIHPDDL